MKLCKCKNKKDLQKLNQVGIGNNNEYIEVNPNYVIIKTGNCTIKISQRRFEQFTNWYFEDQ